MNLDKFCQSCMMPKDSDLFTASTEKDGSLNKVYCSYCYVSGEFSMSDTIKTAGDIQEMEKKGVGKVKRWFCTIGIPKLGRWKKR